MSLNQLIADNYKPWLNIRVNDLVIDGTSAIQGDLETTGLILGSGTALRNYEIVDVTAELGGTLVLVPFSISLRFMRTGNLVTVSIQPFTIVAANQNPAGGILLITFSFPAGMEPLESFEIPMVIQDVGGGSKLSDIVYNFGSGEMQIEDVPNSPQFPAAATNNMSFKKTTIQWTV